MYNRLVQLQHLNLKWTRTFILMIEGKRRVSIATNKACFTHSVLAEHDNLHNTLPRTRISTGGTRTIARRALRHDELHTTNRGFEVLEDGDRKMC